MEGVVGEAAFSKARARDFGSVAFRKKLGRAGVLGFLAKDPRCVVAMEACAGAHHWGRQIGRLGHEVRLVPPAYVKPYVKRHKNDAADAEAVCEAATRATMRFVAVKSEAQQTHGDAVPTRDSSVRRPQRLRGHLASSGWSRRRGRWASASGVGGPGRGIADRCPGVGRGVSGANRGPEPADTELERQLRANARADEETRRLMGIPGVGPITASALRAFAPPMENFRRGRDFSAWLGLVPRQHSTGGKPRLGRISKMWPGREASAEGAMSVIRQAVRSWLALLVAVALANKMARIAWALMRNKEDYREPAPLASAGACRGMWAGHRKGKGKRSSRRGRGNQLYATRSIELAGTIRTRPAHRPFGPAASV